jgi:hypothetical protein
MSDSLLIKEFREKDVRRLRNIFNRKAGDATTTQVGFSVKEAERNEGDVWMEDGKEWTIKGGIKQTNTKLDGIKKLFTTPMLCPVCGGRMKDKLDKKMYHLQGKCFSCVQAYETKLKLEGKYEEYANKIMIDNAKTFLEEAKEYVQEIQNQNTEFVTEAGLKEDWGGPQVNQQVVEHINKEISDLEDLITSRESNQNI